MRLDQALAQLRIAPSRSKAQELIRGEQVEVQIKGLWQLINDVSFEVDPLTVRIRLKSAEIIKYVSRGGLKLEHALQHCGLDVKNFRCLDVGQSTGGFTHCLLDAGAKEVVGFDVGHDQLHLHLQTDPRVKAFQGVHIKDLSSHPQLAQLMDIAFDLCVVDVSFISLKQVLPVLRDSLARPTPLLALVKPQFELDAKALNKKGIVTDEKLLHSVKSRIYDLALENDCEILDYFPCGLRGQDGNQEFFLYGKINPRDHSHPA